MQALPNLDKNTPKGRDIRRLQGLLIAAGQKLPQSTEADGTLDGEWGEETEKALKAVTGTTTVGVREWKHLLGV